MAAGPVPRLPGPPADVLVPRCSRSNGAMLSFQNVTLLDKGRAIPGTTRPHAVLEGATLDVPWGAFAVVGEERDRSALIDLIVRRREASKGRLRRAGRFSFPIGRLGPFSLPVQGSDAVRHICRLYDMSERDTLVRLKEILPFPDILEQRLDAAPIPYRSALSLAVGTLLDVDVLVLDGNPADPLFPPAFLDLLAEALLDAVARDGLLIASRQHEVVAALVSQSLLIETGSLDIIEGVPAPRGTPLAEQTAVEAEFEDSDLIL